jgi:hypothetical protein
VETGNNEVPARVPDSERESHPMIIDKAERCAYAAVCTNPATEVIDCGPVGLVVACQRCAEVYARIAPRAPRRLLVAPPSPVRGRPSAR